MADAFILNKVPSSYGETIKLIFDMWIAAGWVCKSSGDGLASYNSTGYTFTGFAGGATANSTANAKAWARFQSADTNREFVVQVDNAGGVRVKYTPSGTFTGGTPSATQTPSATLEKYVMGNTTDAVPTYKTGAIPATFNTSNGKLQGGARSATPYGFWIAGGSTGGSACTWALAFDPVSGDASDVDQWIWYTDKAASGNSPFALNSAFMTALTPGTNVDAVEGFIDVATTNWTSFSAMGYVADAVTIAGTGGTGVNPFSGKNDLNPIIYERRAGATGTTGRKGFSNNFRWTFVTKTNMVDTAGTKAWICLGTVWAFWDGVTVPSQ